MKNVPAAARVRKYPERINFTSKYADLGTGLLLILKIFEHPSKLWRPYQAPYLQM